MRHKKIILAISLFTLIFFPCLSGFASAWQNGTYISHLETQNQYNMCAFYATRVPPYEDPIECYKRFYQAQDSAFYSTHDFIPQLALDYLCASDPSGKYNWLKDPSQRYLYIFLLATEYPDYRYSNLPFPLQLNNVPDIGSLVQRSNTNLAAITAVRNMAIKAIYYLIFFFQTLFYVLSQKGFNLLNNLISKLRITPFI